MSYNKLFSLSQEYNSGIYTNTVSWRCTSPRLRRHRLKARRIKEGESVKIVFKMKQFLFHSCCHLYNKTFVSDAALRQHCLSKHGMHLCLFCGRSCASDNALEQHTASKHTVLPMLPAVHHGHGSRPYHHEPGIATFAQRSVSGSQRPLGTAGRLLRQQKLRAL